jgi:transposase
MDKLDDVTVEELQRALDEVERKKPAQRILAAISYKHGVTQTELAERHDVSRKTIYSWLERFSDAGSLAKAARDAERSGRPRRLSGTQQNQLERMLHDPPTEAGYDAPAWTAALVQRFLRESFDLEYSRASCRRFMKEAGLSYQKPRRTAAEADPDDRDEFHDEMKKSDGRWTPP